MNDALMRFFDQCTRFVQEVDKNPAALSEMDKFKKGPEMRRVQEKIADRLSVPYSNITDGQWWRKHPDTLFKFKKTNSSYYIVKVEGSALLSLHTQITQ